MKTILVTLICLSYVCITPNQEHLDIDTTKSKINWSCDYTFYFNGHYGTIDFEKGYFIKSNDVIVGGEFVIDMNSIICLDIEKQDANESLVNHIKDPDFFDVNTFPKSKLTITNVDYVEKTTMEISADLEIKGQTLPIRFRAEVDYDLKQMTTKFKIDRTRWGITYNSKMKDGAISDAIGFEVTLRL